MAVGFSCFFSSRRLSPFSGRVTEKEWLREMRKQIEFSKTIARRGGAVVGRDGDGSGGTRHLQVQGRFTSGGQVPELIVRKGDGENTKEKVKGRRGREIRAPTGAGGSHKGQINDEDGGNESSRRSCL